MKQLVPELKASNQPTVVWFYDPTDDQGLQKIDGTIMKNENVGIALKRFNCYRVNTQEIPDGEMKTKYMKEVPAFYFFDPSGGPLASVTGKRAASLSGFTKLLEGTWDKSFTVSLKEFSKQYKEILDGFDKVDVKQQAVTRDRQKLEEKPNPQLKREVEAAEAELAKEKAKVEEQEKAIMENCKLRPEFLPAAGKGGSE